MGVLRVGERQGSLQVQGHDHQAGGGAVEGQQLFDQVGGLRRRAAALRGCPTDRKDLPVSFSVQLLLGRVHSTRLWQGCVSAAPTRLPALLGSTCPLIAGAEEGARVPSSPGTSTIGSGRR